MGLLRNALLLPLGVSKTQPYTNGASYLSLSQTQTTYHALHALSYQRPTLPNPHRPA